MSYYQFFLFFIIAELFHITPTFTYKDLMKITIRNTNALVNVQAARKTNQVCIDESKQVLSIYHEYYLNLYDIE